MASRAINDQYDPGTQVETGNRLTQPRAELSENIGRDTARCAVPKFEREPEVRVLRPEVMQRHRMLRVLGQDDLRRL